MEDNSNNKLSFKKVNYMIMLVGLLVMCIGFFVMSIDKETFGFGTLGLTVGPIILMTSFIIQFFAILYKAKS